MIAALFDQLPGGDVQCRLCGHYCRIAPGRRGRCRVRQNVSGELHSLADKVIAAHIDPIEKKPLFHFLPGSRTFSIAAVGCNFRCRFCQNHNISQYPFDHDEIPGEAADPPTLAETARLRGCSSISYTYTEPTVFFELARDVGLAARAIGLKNIFVSNGYMSAEAVPELARFLDAANIDLKSFSDRFYQELCQARLQPVLDSIRALHAAGVWVEVTTLLIPGRNDDPGELSDLAGFLSSVDRDIPWHVSAFHPDYLLTDPPRTNPAALEKACRIGRDQGLRYVYCGNVPGHQGENTVCPACGKTVIGRIGFQLTKIHLENGNCGFCGQSIAGVGLAGEPR